MGRSGATSRTAGVGSRKGRTKSLVLFFFLVSPPLFSSPSFCSAAASSSASSSSSLVLVPVGLQATTPPILNVPPTALDKAPSALRAAASSDECSSAAQVAPRVDASETSSSSVGGVEFFAAVEEVDAIAAPFPPIPESLTQMVSAPRVDARGTGSEAADSRSVESAVQRSCGVGSPSGGFFFVFRGRGEKRRK